MDVYLKDALWPSITESLAAEFGPELLEAARVKAKDDLGEVQRQRLKDANSKYRAKMEKLTNQSH